MDQCKGLAADCIVVCTCVPCLAVKIAAFVLLRLPCRLARSVGRFVRRNLLGRPARRRRKFTSVGAVAAEGNAVVDAWCDGLGSAGWRCPIEAAEEIQLELYNRGVIGFGIFGRSFHESFELEDLVSSGLCVWEMYIFDAGR